ncbi:MAG: helix-turn-helix domain-containing protein [Clostridiales bacterium]|nr:helix-turn-helix domain-containing protein [Clostridiales bacterium]
MNMRVNLLKFDIFLNMSYYICMIQYKVDELSIEYRSGFNYKAELCRIRCTVPHVHPYDLELVYCLDGTITLVSGEQIFKLEPGSLFSVDYNECHYMCSDEPALVLILHIDLRKVYIDWELLRYRIFTCESTHCFPYQQNAMDRLKDLILALSSAQFTSSASAEDTAKPVDKIIEVMIRYFDWFNYENPDEYINPDLHDRFYRSLEYCIINYKKKISASDLATKEHINPNYFSQFLATTVFNSFSYMIKFVRCFNAEHLLLQTDMPNYEIAYSVGFSDPKYFYSSFEYWWHRSPKEHRQMYQNQFEICKKIENGFETVSDSEAVPIIEKYISRWHLIKILR